MIGILIDYPAQNKMKEYIGRFLMIFFLVGVMSCAQQPSAKARPLWDHFSTYRNYVKTDELVGVDERNYFSDKAWKMLDELKSRSDKGMLHEFFVKFPNHLRKVIESKESALGDAGCLLVMGVDDSNNPVDYFISYVREDARWVFDEVTINYAFDGEKRVVTDPICDQEKRKVLWLEYMQGQYN